VGVGFPSAMHSKTAGVNNGAVVRRSGPADKILGGSAGDKCVQKERTREKIFLINFFAL
jgi:hypothetical protein